MPFTSCEPNDKEMRVIAFLHELHSFRVTTDWCWKAARCRRWISIRRTGRNVRIGPAISSKTALFISRDFIYCVVDSSKVASKSGRLIGHQLRHVDWNPSPVLLKCVEALLSPVNFKRNWVWSGYLSMSAVRFETLVTFAEASGVRLQEST